MPSMLQLDTALCMVRLAQRSSPEERLWLKHGDSWALLAVWRFSGM